MFHIGRANQSDTRTATIYGVNLGGWLVLEKWITPSLFKGTAAEDEYTFCAEADESRRRAITEFRKSFITLSDFRWLQEHGIGAVRLPVGYGVFGDAPPYLRTIEYVDNVFDWALQTGLKVVLDMHAAPGSQNGKQESGRIGEVGWHKDPENIFATLRVLERLAERYGKREALLGIELLNEPGGAIPRRVLLRYYRAAYRMIRDKCGDRIWVIFSDGFKPRRWKRQLGAPGYSNVYIDTHQYQIYTPRDHRLDIYGHIKKTLTNVAGMLRKMSRYHPVIVGEWSMALNEKSLKSFTPEQMAMARSVYGGAQRIVYEGMAAWFYWTYKTEDRGPWNFRAALERGWLAPIGQR